MASKKKPKKMSRKKEMTIPGAGKGGYYVYLNKCLLPVTPGKIEMTNTGQMFVLYDDYGKLTLKNLYRVVVRVNLINKKNFSMVKEMLEEVIPANMEIDLSLLYNQHETLAKFTHKELAKYTHRQIREEVLSYVNENE